MECRRKIRRRAKQSRQIWLGERTVGADSTRDDPGWLEPSDPPDLLRHQPQLITAIDEVAAAWANHHKNRNLYPIQDVFYERQTRRGPTDFKPSAQLDPLRARALRGDGGVGGFDGGLDQYLLSGRQRL
jgi:hypothetical protein